jgi:hypothetical protein
MGAEGGRGGAWQMRREAAEGGSGKSGQNQGDEMGRQPVFMMGGKGSTAPVGGAKQFRLPDHRTASLCCACQHSTIAAGMRQIGSWPGAAKSGGRRERGGVGSQEGGTRRQRDFPSFPPECPGPVPRPRPRTKAGPILVGIVYKTDLDRRACQEGFEQKLQEMRTPAKSGAASCKGSAAKRKKTGQRQAGAVRVEGRRNSPFCLPLGPAVAWRAVPSPWRARILLPEGSWQVLAFLGASAPTRSCAQLSNQSRADSD